PAAPPMNSAAPCRVQLTASVDENTTISCDCPAAGWPRATASMIPVGLLARYGANDPLASGQEAAVDGQAGLPGGLGPAGSIAIAPPDGTKACPFVDVMTLISLPEATASTRVLLFIAASATAELDWIGGTEMGFAASVVPGTGAGRTEISPLLASRNATYHWSL